MAAPQTPEPGARDIRRASLILAATALFWILASEAGSSYGWPQGARLAVDLIALAGFGLGLWLAYRVWRARRPG